MNKLLLVGAGHMGTSLLKGWKKNKIKYISVVDPKVSQKNKKVKNIQYYKSLSQIKDINKFNIIFFAVKPQVINKVIKDYKKVYLKNKLIISIIAGKNISFFEHILGSDISIVRTMPNLPASIGKGVTCLLANKKTNIKQKKYVEKLFNAVGKIFWVKDETYIDKITAISGRGPAYFYYFIEALRDSGNLIGIDKNLAYELAKETAIGSINLLEKSNQNAEKIRKQIMLKGGTTEAAINELGKNDKLRKVVLKGVRSAYMRSIKLGKKT